MPLQHLVCLPPSIAAFKKSQPISEVIFSFPFCDLPYLNINKGTPSLSGLMRQLCFWGKMAEEERHAGSSLCQWQGCLCKWLESRACRTWDSIQYDKERQASLVFDEACVVFSKDRKAPPFEEFPVVLSLMSTLRGVRKCNKRTYCPYSEFYFLPPFLNLIVCADYLALQICGHDFCLNVCFCLHDCHHPVRETKNSFMVGSVCSPQAPVSQYIRIL